MAQTVAEFILDRLTQWDIKRIYGYPGDGINGLMAGFESMGERLEFIQARHEELAAFMACAHAKFTGEVGVCMATSGPGAIHLLNGLYDAKLDHQPVVAIIGQQKRASLGSDYQQEVDLLSLFKDVAHEFVQMITTPAQARHVIDRAVRIALDQRSVTCVIVPNDLQEMSAVPSPPREHGSVYSGIGVTARATVPPDRDLMKAAEILNQGKKVAMLVGAGALHATREILEAADLLGAGVAKALLGKAAVPDDVPFVTGAIGILGTQPSWTMMDECDTLLMVGTSFPYSEYLPKDGQAKGVQIDIDGRRLSLRYPMDVNLVGDSKETLRALIPLLERKADRSWQDRIVSQVERWWRVVEERAMTDADPINPQRVFWELSPHLPDNCILTCDSSSAVNWFARDLKLRPSMMASLSGGLATMGPAVPYAIAAKFAHPDRVAIALVGDGAMQMNGISALITIAHQWRRWSDPRLIIMVLNNGDLNQVTWEQRGMTGAPRFAASQDLPNFPYADYARLLGLQGIRVERPEQIASAWSTAFKADRPVLLEMITDPNVVPIPPHIPLKYAKSFISALFKGDPESIDIIKQTAKQVWDGLFPGKGGSL